MKCHEVTSDKALSEQKGDAMEPETTGLDLSCYDLHSHTTASDGMLTPEQLLDRAAEMGVTVLAITDHDTTDALPAAHHYQQANNLPLKVINGVEISTHWEHHEIHIVGLNIDITHPAMTELLAQQSARRRARGMLISERLAKAGIEGTWEEANALAQGGEVTRGHFARVLIARGVEPTIPKVFKRYLARNKTGYVPPQWCDIPDAVKAVHAAGGQAVLAHPGRYGLSAKWLKRLCDFFKQAGGDAMEVAQCQQAPDERRTLAQYAVTYGLKASQGSDFHQPCSWIELGRKLWLPGDVIPIWQDWSLKD